MKAKSLHVLIAALLVFGVTATGHAAFTYGDLIRVVYDASTGVEEATDLGSLSAILAKSGAQTLGGGGLTVQLGDFGASQTWANLNVAYFAANSTGSATSPLSYGVVSSTGAAGSITNNVNSWNGFSTYVNYILNTYASNNTPSYPSKAVVPDIGSGHSYYNLMDGATLTGSETASFYNWLSSQTGETNAGAGSSQEMSLFQWTGSGINAPFGRHGTVYGLDVIQAGTLIAGLQTVEGVGGLYTMLTSTVAPVPVPPSVLLLAPGLLGLIGLRRKIRN